jgi:hypothetical protein
VKQVKIIAVPMKAVGRMLAKKKTISLRATSMWPIVKGIVIKIKRHKTLLKQSPGIDSNAQLQSRAQTNS